MRIVSSRPLGWVPKLLVGVKCALGRRLVCMYVYPSYLAITLLLPLYHSRLLPAGGRLLSLVSDDSEEILNLQLSAARQFRPSRKASMRTLQKIPSQR